MKAVFPRDIATQVNKFLQAKDLEGIVSLFHPACLVFFPPDAPPKVGAAGVRDAFAAFMDDPPAIESEILSEVIVGDIALLRARWRLVAPDGTVLASGESTEVATKLENGGWGYLIDCPYGPPLTDRS